MKPEEIIGNMEQFTQEELARINELATNTAENITFEDMKLFSRWETSEAIANERFQAELKTLEAENAAKIEQSQQIADAAAANLQAQADLARARLEAVQNGQI